MRQDSILVTGCGGFIGSNLCHKLVAEENYKVIGLDGFFTGSNRKNLTGLYDKLGFKVLNCDIRNNHALTEVFRTYHIDYIVHLAAESFVDRSIECNNPFWSTNVVGTVNLLNLAKQFHVKKFINQITDEVFGPIKSGSSKETSPIRPTSPYAASKASQYLAGKSHYITYELPVISTFPSNTYGPRQWPEKLIPKFIMNLMSNKQVPLMQSSHFVRDWLSVEDHIDALVFLLEKGSIGEDYNIGGDCELTNLEITERLIKIMDKPNSLIDIVPDRKAHDCRYSVSNAKINKLGWKPTKSNIDTYLPMTVDWYRKNYLMYK